MLALEIEHNGQRVVVAGASKATMIAADITAAIHETGASLDIRGMKEAADDGGESHITWVELAPIAYDDRITFRFVDVGGESVTPPMEETFTDSPEYASAQAEYLELVQNNPLTIQVLDIKQPNATLSLLPPDQNRITAIFEQGREFMTCSFLWTKWRPEQCRVSLRSFSQEEALEKTGGKEWFKGTLKLGEACTVQLQC